MKNAAEILTTVSRTFAAPSMGGNETLFTVTAQVYLLLGNKHPCFSVMGKAYESHKRNDPFAGGAMHDEAARFWPEIAPIIELHLSNADDGEPMHAEANGFYWLAGAVWDNLGEKYFGGVGGERCLATLAKHLRIDVGAARELATKAGEQANPRQWFAAYIDAQRPRWKREAEAGLALLARPAAETAAK